MVIVCGDYVVAVVLCLFSILQIKKNILLFFFRLFKKKMIPAFITISADHTYDFEAQENAVKWRGIFVNPLRKVSLALSLTVKIFSFKCQLHFVVL